MDFSEIKTGDIIKVTVAAHKGRKNGLGGGAMIDKPEAVRMVRVMGISKVAGQPGRHQADCIVLVNENGEDFRGRVADFSMPSFAFYDSYGAGSPEVTIERAE